MELEKLVNSYADWPHTHHISKINLDGKATRHYGLRWASKTSRIKHNVNTILMIDTVITIFPTIRYADANDIYRYRFHDSSFQEFQSSTIIFDNLYVYPYLVAIHRSSGVLLL